MPEVAPPEEVPDLATVIEEMKRTAPDRPRPFLDQTRPFEFRPAYMPDPETAPEHVLKQPHMKIWFKTPHELPDDPVLHHTLVGLCVGLLPARGRWIGYAIPGRSRASCKWRASITRCGFIVAARADDWLLYVLDSPSAASSRGMAIWENVQPRRAVSRIDSTGRTDSEEALGASKCPSFFAI